MVEQGEFRVAASLHAAERALQRVPALANRTRPYASRWIELTASDALVAGRRARRVPRWCSRPDDESRGRVRSQGTQRFVWDELETVALLVHRCPDKHGGSAIWLIKTVIV